MITALERSIHLSNREARARLVALTRCASDPNHGSRPHRFVLITPAGIYAGTPFRIARIRLESGRLTLPAPVALDARALRLALEAARGDDRVTILLNNSHAVVVYGDETLPFATGDDRHRTVIPYHDGETLEPDVIGLLDHPLTTDPVPAFDIDSFRRVAETAGTLSILTRPLVTDRKPGRIAVVHPFTGDVVGVLSPVASTTTRGDTPDA